MDPNILRLATVILQNYVGGLQSCQKAAVIINALSPGVKLEVYRYLSSPEVQRLMDQMEGLPHCNSIETLAVIDEFFSCNNLWHVMRVRVKESAEMVSALERWARRNPRKLAVFLRDRWLLSE